MPRRTRPAGTEKVATGKKRNREPRIGTNGTATPLPTVPAQPAPLPLPWHTGADLEAQPIRWLFPGYLPAGVPTLLYGPSKRGKSTCLRAMVAALTRGEDLSGYPCGHPRHVVWLAGEEDYDSVTHPRLLAAGALGHYLHYPERLKGVARRKLRVLDHGREIQSIVERVGASLIVFDPIRRYVGAGLDPESGQAADQVMAALTDLGTLTGCASVAVMHPRKGGRGAADEQVSGHQNWYNACRNCVKNVPFPGRPGECALIVQGASLGPQPPALRWKLVVEDGQPVCKWAGTCGLTIEQASRGGECPEDEAATEDAQQFLRARLDDGSQKVRDLQRWGQENGLSIHQLYRARIKLGVISRWDTSGEDKASVWEKPEGGWPK